ncbi:hypothetical protein QN277_025977 [Acacia crassicarpa]|uniref:Uncharacterized protein n=1 Tax=Acacia crassicarpa TaxID=499986 RepID=A0AAE1JB26_9FABA|nr:hypothetical protein QN277_025977 [Acacia crassicarpa]
MHYPGEVVLEIPGIPWLLLVQLVVAFLLLALFLWFTVFTLDSSDDASIASATAGTSTLESASTSGLLFDDIRPVEKPSAKHDSATTTTLISHRLDMRGGENRSIKGEVSAGTTRRIVSGEEFGERDGSSRFHPCHYFQLARVAFLKCFGLDPASDSPTSKRHRKPKQS